MTPPHRSLAIRLALSCVALACAGALAGCSQPPALTKAELDGGKLSKKHPQVDPKVASNCRKCHREQPAIKKK